MKSKFAYEYPAEKGLQATDEAFLQELQVFVLVVVVIVVVVVLVWFVFDFVFVPGICPSMEKYKRVKIIIVKKEKEKKIMNRILNLKNNFKRINNILFHHQLPPFSSLQKINI